MVLDALCPAYSGVAALYWLSATGIATTVAHSSSRWTTMMPLVCLFAAAGLDFFARSARTHRPDVTSIDVHAPWSVDESPPPIDDTVIFIVLPERSAELSTLERWYPDGTKVVVNDEARSPAFVAFVLHPSSRPRLGSA